MSAAIDNPRGNYRFLPGIAPFSSGAAATAGHQVVHVTLKQPIPWRKGFELIDAHLKSEGRPRQALCAIELRIPKALTFDGFDGFNEGYQALLKDWDLLVNGENPVARTNVAPVVGAPSEASLYGFGYTMPGATPSSTFVVAGSGETKTREKSMKGLVRGGETSPDAIREKAAFVLGVMRDRLHGLGGDWADVTAINVYTAHPIEPFLADVILRGVGPAAVHGVTWHLSAPPILDIEFEMDMRGVQRRMWL